MPLKITNNAETRLLNPVSVNSTSFTVNQGEGSKFPTLAVGEFFFARLGTHTNNEVVKVTQRNNDTFTCQPLTKSFDIGALCFISFNLDIFNLFLTVEATGQILKNKVLKNFYTLIESPEINAGVINLDLSEFNIFYIFLEEDITINLTNIPTTENTLLRVTLIIQTNLEGPPQKTITFPSNFAYVGGKVFQPSIDSDAVETELLELISTNSGVTWYVYKRHLGVYEEAEF